jgi:hypothetical protein
MAVNPTPTTIQQNLPSPYIEGALTSLSERLLPLLSTSAAINTGSYAPQVAGINQFTQAGQQQAARQAGLGSLGFDPTTGTVTKKNVSFGSLEVLMLKVIHYTLSPMCFTPKLRQKTLRARRHSV